MAQNILCTVKEMLIRLGVTGSSRGTTSLQDEALNHVTYEGLVMAG